MSHKLNLTGKTFGKLLVISEDHSDGKHLYWKCQCSCGKETIVSGDSLKQGFTKSCGCLNAELAAQRITTHGKYKERLYSIWLNMKHRCFNSNAINFRSYGGRGITVCDEWKNDFQVFYDWAMSNGYSDNLTIDRIDNDGNYEPTNCQWITLSENIKKSWKDRVVIA